MDRGKKRRRKSKRAPKKKKISPDFVQTTSGEANLASQILDSNDEYCGNCGDGGDLLCCDSCPKAFHLRCINPPLSCVPEGDWECRSCRSKRNTSKEFDDVLLGPLIINAVSKNPSPFTLPMSIKRSVNMHREDALSRKQLRERKKKNDFFCSICGLVAGELGCSEELLNCCDCQRSYHLYCLEPAFLKMPKVPWRCPNHKDLAEYPQQYQTILDHDQISKQGCVHVIPRETVRLNFSPNNVAGGSRSSDVVPWRPSSPSTTTTTAKEQREWLSSLTAFQVDIARHIASMPAAPTTTTTTTKMMAARHPKGDDESSIDARDMGQREDISVLTAQLVKEYGGSVDQLKRDLSQFFAWRSLLCATPPRDAAPHGGASSTTSEERERHVAHQYLSSLLGYVGSSAAHAPLTPLHDDDVEEGDGDEAVMHSEEHEERSLASIYAIRAPSRAYLRKTEKEKTMAKRRMGEISRMKKAEAVLERIGLDQAIGDVDEITNGGAKKGKDNASPSSRRRNKGGDQKKNGTNGQRSVDSSRKSSLSSCGGKSASDDAPTRSSTPRGRNGGAKKRKMSSQHGARATHRQCGKKKKPSSTPSKQSYGRLVVEGRMNFEAEVVEKAFELKAAKVIVGRHRNQWDARNVNLKEFALSKFISRDHLELEIDEADRTSATITALGKRTPIVNGVAMERNQKMRLEPNKPIDLVAGAKEEVFAVKWIPHHHGM